MMNHINSIDITPLTTCNPTVLPPIDHDGEFCLLCYTCGLNLADLDPITLLAQWDDGILYITFECACHTTYEIRLTPEVLQDTMEPVSCQ